MTWCPWWLQLAFNVSYEKKVMSISQEYYIPPDIGQRFMPKRVGLLRPTVLRAWVTSSDDRVWVTSSYDFLRAWGTPSYDFGLMRAWGTSSYDFLRAWGISSYDFSGHETLRPTIFWGYISAYWIVLQMLDKYIIVIVLISRLIFIHKIT